jgi:hypothetical protein
MAGLGKPFLSFSYVTLRQKSKSSIALGGGLGLTKQSLLAAMSIYSYHAGATTTFATPKNNYTTMSGSQRTTKDSDLCFHRGQRTFIIALLRGGTR